MADNFHSVIDLTDLLKDLKCDCTLDDVLTVYKLYHLDTPEVQNEQLELHIEDIKRCDKIITEFGFDKEWGQYFHNSRRVLGN